jgi:hypothetical protein
LLDPVTKTLFAIGNTANHAMKKEDLLIKARDPKYISGIYNYCDRWCERCQFTSRCLNCSLVEEQFGDLEAVDSFNEDFWKTFSGMLQNTLDLVREMVREEGIDIEKICAEEDTHQRKVPLPDIISHLSKKYATSVGEWFDSADNLFYEKEEELNRIQLVSSGHDPAGEALKITDAVEIIRWYQFFISVKLKRACDRAADEAIDDDGFPKDSDGSAKIALIGIDRSIAAWKILVTQLTAEKRKIISLIELLENLKNRVENRFPHARSFKRPGFDDPI